MHIKINFSGVFSGVPFEEDSTISHIISYILQKNDVPLSYAQYCVILQVGADKFGYPLSPTDLVRNHQDSALHFRIIRFPESLDDVDEHFQELMQNQIHKMVISASYWVDQKTAVRLAARVCSAVFGPYHNQQFGFLTKTLSQLVPHQYSSDEVENYILTEWQTLQLNVNPVSLYLTEFVTNIQYGYVPFSARLEQQPVRILFGPKMILLFSQKGEIMDWIEPEKVAFPAEMRTDVVFSGQKEWKAEMNGCKAVKEIQRVIIGGYVKPEEIQKKKFSFSGIL
ncbi:Conserved_hypothetical protein [Hexamita inflata]|uniref:FERM central domain-containing protein n=1 Tax=Hexamita inflata TaxID=28002 RepID=A0ABP1HR56_9EUKA